MRKGLFGGKWRFLVLTLFILPLAIGTYGCGGGGGGDDAGDIGSPAPAVPIVVNYGVGKANIDPVPPLLYGTAASGADFNFTKLDLSGTINRNTDEITLVSFNEDWQIMSGNGADFTYNPAPAALGGGAINVRVRIPTGGDVRWIGGSDPTEGTYEVSMVDAQGETILGPFRVVVAPNRPGAAGVYIYNINDLVNPLSSLPWDGFKNAVETSNNNYEVLPSLAYNALQAVYRYLSNAYTLLTVVFTYDSELEASQVLGFTGDNFPGTGAGAANLTVQWLDQNTNSNLGPGDGFMSMFTFWWDDVSEYIYNGHLRILDYWEQEAAGNSFVGGNFRFGPDGGLPSDFTEQEPVNNNYDPNDPKTTVGGSIFFLVYW